MRNVTASRSSQPYDGGVRRTFVIAGWFAALGLLVAGVMDVVFAVSHRFGWQVQYWDWVTWVYPSSLGFMAGDSNPHGLVLGLFIVVLVALQNATLYFVAGLLLGFVWVRLRPRPAVRKS